MKENQEHQDTNISFKIDADYSSDYMRETQDPERHMSIKHMYKSLHDNFSVFIDKNEKFGFLRSIDLSLVRVGDKIGCVDNNIEGIIINMGDDSTYEVDFNGTILKISSDIVKPLDVYVNKLKLEDICMLYESLRVMCTSGYFDEIDFFYVFSEYFKINDGKIWKSISPKTKSVLLEELNKRTNVLKNKKITSLW